MEQKEAVRDPASVRQRFATREPRRPDSKPPACGRHAAAGASAPQRPRKPSPELTGTAKEIKTN